MADRPPLKSAFIFSDIFETQEEAKKTPFEFRLNDEEEKEPAILEEPTITYSGNLFRRLVSYPWYQSNHLCYNLQDIDSADSSIEIQDGGSLGNSVANNSQDDNSTVKFDKDFYELNGHMLQRYAS